MISVPGGLYGPPFQPFDLPWPPDGYQYNAADPLAEHFIQTLRAFRRAHICMQLQKDVSNLYDMLAILIDSCMDLIPD